MHELVDVWKHELVSVVVLVPHRLIVSEPSVYWSVFVGCIDVNNCDCDGALKL